MSRYEQKPEDPYAASLGQVMVRVTITMTKMLYDLRHKPSILGLVGTVAMAGTSDKAITEGEAPDRR